MNKPSAQPATQTPTTTNATTTPQVQAQEITAGTGTTAALGNIVSVLYVGKLENGIVFDSSAAHDNQPLRFALGTNGLIVGFQVGVNGMKEGGERLIKVPPELAYGTQVVKDQAGNVIIPANSNLFFDIKLVKVEAASSTAPVATTTTKKTM